MKAQVSYSDRLLSIVHLSICKLLHFLLLLQNRWAYFNQTWHKSSLREGIQVFQMTGIAALQGEIVAKEKKYTEIFLKSSCPESAGQNQSNLLQIILW